MLPSYPISTADLLLGARLKLHGENSPSYYSYKREGIGLPSLRMVFSSKTSDFLATLHVRGAWW
jgi:hypothetical protein